MNIQEIDPSGLVYDVTIGYGKDNEKRQIHTLEGVVRIEGYQIEHSFMVNFFRADGALVGSFPRGHIHAIELSIEEI